LEAAEAGFALTFSSAGHPLPLLLRSDGTVHDLGTHGLLLGANPEPQLVESTSVLHPADCLLLYTDGLTDAYAPAHAASRADIQSLLASHASSSSNEIADELYRRMLDLGPSEPRDDVALVVVRIGTHVPHAPVDPCDSAAAHNVESRR
jgi:serine phosphatase RsbU (regulator of sigma subunit)